MKLSRFMKQLQPWLDRYGDDCEIFISGAWTVREPLVGGVGNTVYLIKGEVVSWKKSDPDPMDPSG